jgi:hypothetical protein
MMALNGQAYAVDLERLRAVFGSKDKQLLTTMLERVAEAYYFPEDEDVGMGDALQAITDIIEGDCRLPRNKRHLYGYAIEDLCQYFGEVIPIPTEFDADEIGDPEDLEIDSPLTSGELPIPVPAWDDTPYVRFLTAALVPEEFKRLTGEDLSHDDPSIEEGRQLLLRQLQWAADRGKAFVTVVNG